MGKQGPCYHCGVTIGVTKYGAHCLDTPLWRNGPPEKPVLCNACGSRWRTKGTLANYTPLHARVDSNDYEDHRVTRVKSISLKKRDEKLNKRKLNYESTIDEGFTADYSQDFQKNLDEDTSNRSSSGSAISNSESCAQFGSADASDLTGPAQSIVWDALVPSRKRTCVTRAKQSSVEKLTKDLYTILHEQASHFSGSSEEDLLFESEAPMVSVEIGHGSVLIRHPSSMGREEESEASSLSVDNKPCRVDEGYSYPSFLLSPYDSKCVNGSRLGTGKVKKLNGQIMQLEQAKRDKSNHEKLHTLWTHNSPLHYIDLTEVVNSETFFGHLSADEQQELFTYLPSVDTSVLSESFGSMFSSPYFKENLSSFQQLLAEGVFDTSFPGVKSEDCKLLKTLALSNLTKCKWVEHYNMLKDKRAKQSTGECASLSEPKSSFSGNLVNVKKVRDSQNYLYPEAKTTMKSQKRLLVKGGYESKACIRNEGSYFTPTPGTLFALQTDGGSLMFDSFQFEDESSDQDLLLDVPSNGSFPEAELLRPASSFASQQASASSSSIHPAHIHT